MAVKINPIVANTSPNLYVAAKAANLPQDQVNQLEQFSWTVDKNKRLNKLPVEAARKEFNELDPEAQQKLKYLFPNADYSLADPGFSDYSVGALKQVGKVVASPLIGIFKLAGAWNRVINTPYLVARQAAQGEGIWNKQTWADAWDGRRVYDHGSLQKATDYFGVAKVEVAKGLIAGKTPGQIITSLGGTANQDMLAAIEEAYNNPESFKQVLDGVKYAQVSPGRDIARNFTSKNPNTTTAGEDYVSGTTKNISGVIDFFYQLAVDPTTYATGGLATLARKVPMVGNIVGANRFGSQMRATIEQYGTAGVKEIFANEANGVAKLWNDKLGPRIKDIADAPVSDKPALINSVREQFPAYNNFESIKTLVDNKIFDAKSAQRYFEQAENLPAFMAGRVDGHQYFRNGIATASAHRRLSTGLYNKIDGFLNPATYKSNEELAAATDDIWTSLLKSTPENGNVSPEMEDLRKFQQSTGIFGKARAAVSKAVKLSPQGRVVKVGEDAIKTAENFRLNALQVMPKDMANFMTYKFVNAPTNEQISIMKAIDYAIIERHGITGLPGGKDLAQEIINVKYGLTQAGDDATEMIIKPEVAAMLSKDSYVVKDGVHYMKSGNIVQPYQETNAFSSLDFFNLSQVAYGIKSKNNLFHAVGGSMQSKTATEMVNAWSMLTLFPRLGIRSSIDEGTMYLLTAPVKNIMDLFIGKGHRAGNLASAYSGSKSGERIRQLVARKLGFSTASEVLDVAAREQAIAKYADSIGKEVSALLPRERRYAQALAANDVINKNTISKLDDEEANDLIEVLSLNSQFLGSAARSITSASNITGRQAPEVAEQLLDQNQFDKLIKNLQKDFKLEVGGKGKLVDVAKLERDNILNGTAASVIHYENFVKRFYKNRKSIEGDLGKYDFNPKKVFLKNNALKDEADWRKAREEMLNTVGIRFRADTPYIQAGETGEVGTKFLYYVADKKALNNFLSSRGYVTVLRDQGLDDIEIANRLVMNSLADTYRYFHGASDKYNQALYDTITDRLNVITKDGTEKVPNAITRAIESISFDEFSKLTKGYSPSGQMYTMLNIEGLDDFGNLYTRLGNKAMEIMDNQVTGIIRQPAVMITYLRLRKFYRKAENEYTQKILADKIARFEGPVSASMKSKLIEEAELQSKKYFSEVAVSQAADEVLKFVDNPTIRSNFSVSARNVGRYYRATEDFWRRILRMKDVAPRAFYRMRLAHVGLDAAGGIYNDQQGDAYVMMPMDNIIFKTVDSTVRALTPGEAGFKQPIFNDFTMKLTLANPSFTPDTGLPTLSGPIGALSVIAMKNVLGQVGGTTGKQIGQEIDNYALGSLGDNIDVVKAIVPSSVQKLWSLLPQNEKSRQEATAAMQAIAYNASQGYMLDPNATDLEKFNYLKNIRLSAHNIIVMRSILGLISPVAPTMQESVGVPDYLKEVGITGLRPEFFDVLNAVTQKYKGDVQDPYELAVATFIGKNRGKLIYTVSRNEKTTNVVINKTKQLTDWAIANGDAIKTYGESAYIFAPSTGDFDFGSYAWLEASGLIKNKDLETYYRDVLVSKDKQAYYDIANEERDFLSTSGDSMARKAAIDSATRRRNQLKAANPLLEQALTGGGNEVGTELNMLRSIEQIILDDKIKVDAGSKQRMAMVTARVRQFVSLANDPTMRELSNFSEIKAAYKDDIEKLIKDLEISDPYIKEANRSTFRAILNYYSRDTYTAKAKY